MTSLNEALREAKKEISTQGERLRDLEARLNEERRAREDAEERANRLERESTKDRDDTEDEHTNGTIRAIPSTEIAEEELPAKLQNGSASPGAADTTARLQQRLELMVAEMTEMKQQMERYRERAETAEADRKSLAEMVENIRQDNARSTTREARRQSRSNGDLSREAATAGHDGVGDDLDAEEGEITIIKDKDLDEDATTELLQRANGSNGHAPELNGDKSSSKATNSLVTRRQDRFDTAYYGGPVGAMVTVVAIGVAVMAMLNQYPKTER